MVKGSRQSGIVQCTAASADRIQKFLSWCFCRFSKVQIKKEASKKLYNQLCEWKHSLTKGEIKTSKSWLGPHQTTSLVLIFPWRSCMWIPMETMLHTRIFFKKLNRNCQGNSANWVTANRAVTVIKNKRRKRHESIPISHISEKIFCIKNQGR